MPLKRSYFSTFASMKIDFHSWVAPGVQDLPGNNIHDGHPVKKQENISFIYTHFNSVATIVPSHFALTKDEYNGINREILTNTSKTHFIKANSVEVPSFYISHKDFIALFLTCKHTVLTVTCEKDAP